LCTHNNTKKKKSQRNTKKLKKIKIAIKKKKKPLFIDAFAVETRIAASLTARRFWNAVGGRRGEPRLYSRFVSQSLT
jgi:hypothetical protein